MDPKSTIFDPKYFEASKTDSSGLGDVTTTVVPSSVSSSGRLLESILRDYRDEMLKKIFDPTIILDDLSSHNPPRSEELTSDGSRDPIITLGGSS